MVRTTVRVFFIEWEDLIKPEGCQVSSVKYWNIIETPNKYFRERLPLGPTNILYQGITSAKHPQQPHSQHYLQSKLTTVEHQFNSTLDFT